MTDLKSRTMNKTVVGYFEGKPRFERENKTTLRDEYRDLRHEAVFRSLHINEVTETSVTYTILPTRSTCTQIPIRDEDTGNRRVRAEKMVYTVEGSIEEIMVLRELIFWEAQQDKSIPDFPFPEPERTKPTSFIKFAIFAMYPLSSYHLLPSEIAALDFYLIDVDTRRLLRKQVRWVDLAAANDLWVEQGKQITFLNYLAEIGIKLDASAA